MIIKWKQSFVYLLNWFIYTLIVDAGTVENWNKNRTMLISILSNPLQLFFFVVALMLECNIISCQRVKYLVKSKMLSLNKFYVEKNCWSKRMLSKKFWVKKCRKGGIVHELYANLAWAFFFDEFYFFTGGGVAILFCGQLFINI